MNTPRLTVWFDGACPLCRREIGLMQRLDRQSAIHFVDVSDGAEGACPIDRQELLQRFHAQERDGPILVGAPAFAAMWRAIPVLRPLGILARWPPVLAFLHLAYRGFLKIRPTFQRLLRET